MDHEAEPPKSAPDLDSAVRAQAFGRLVEFAERPQFRAALRIAVDEFWSPTFRTRPQVEQDLAYARPEAEVGKATYCVLDAPALVGTTVAEQFLAERRRDLSPAEFAYLARLASTRMGLYRIDDVRRDDGLTCTDLWTNECVEIREKLLTHDVTAGYVVAARVFPDVDGGTVFNGAVYLFAAADAHKVVKALRADWKSKRNVDPSLSERQFLKQRFPVVINRFWFDHVFEFDTASGEQRQSRGTPNLRDSATQRLAAFFNSAAAPKAMSIDRLHGFLSAVICSPKMLRPVEWLPFIWGDQSPQFRSQAEAEAVISDIFAVYTAIARTIADGTFEPLLPFRAQVGTGTVAERWSFGFVAGMSINQRSWKRLLDDGPALTLLAPIFLLAAPEASELVVKAEASELRGLIKLLPQAVTTIAALRPTPRARKARTVPRPTAADVDATTTMHRLKITLNGVRPLVWRSVEIASDAKLPFVSRVLISSMGWDDTHLHAFRCGGKSYGRPDPDFPTGMHDEHFITLAEIAPNVKSRFFFDYDFGDSWEHTVVVERIAKVAEARVPRCIDGARACPPEDCGGVSGYAALRKILRSTHDEKYAAMREWAGGDFNSERFDIETVNRKLQRLVRKRRTAAR